MDTRTAKPGSDAAGESAPDMTPSTPKTSDLPSIIVDPTLIAPAPKSGTALDAAQADRFAAAIRPSWAGAAPAVGSDRPAPSKPVSGPPRASIPSGAPLADDAPLQLPLARRKQRALVLTGACILGFMLLVYLGVRSSTRTTTAVAPAHPAPAAPGPTVVAPRPSLVAAKAPEMPAPQPPQPPQPPPPPPPPPPVAATPAPAVAAPQAPAPRPKAARRKPTRVAAPVARPKAPKGAGFVADDPY